MGEKYLVTGGCGFIGQHIANELFSLGNDVRVIDFALSDTLCDGIEILEGDIRSRSDVARAVDGVDYVIHQAAICSVGRSIEKPAHTNACNVDGTLNLLIAAAESGLRHFVYASSSSVYGDVPGIRREEAQPFPLSPYAVSKYAGECYCRSFREIYDLPVTVLRYFNVYGPGQRVDSPYAAVVPRFLGAAKSGLLAVIYGDGQQTRDFTYVDDVVRANILACRQEGKGCCVNIGTGRATSVLELLYMVGDTTGRELNFYHEVPRPGDVLHSVACTDRARLLLGFEATVDLETGLQKTWKWVNEGSVNIKATVAG